MSQSSSRLVLIVILATCFAGCSRQTAHDHAAEGATDVATEGYPLRGVVTGPRPDSDEFLVRHEEIPGFMKAMTMSFHVPDSIRPFLKPGTPIAARLLPRKDDGWHLIRVRLLAESGATLEPGAAYRLPLAPAPQGERGFSGVARFTAPTGGDWQVSSGTHDAWVDLVPAAGGAALESKDCTHENPDAFEKDLRFTLVAGTVYEVRFKNSPIATIDVRIAPFTE